MRSGLKLSIFSLCLLSSCVMYKEPPPARSIEYGTYSCDGSEQFVAQFEDNGERVAYMRDNRTRMLMRNADGTFTDGTFSLSGSEKTPITVYQNGVPILRNCVTLTTQPQYYQKKSLFRYFDPHRDFERQKGLP